MDNPNFRFVLHFYRDGHRSVFEKISAFVGAANNKPINARAGGTYFYADKTIDVYLDNVKRDIFWVENDEFGLIARIINHEYAHYAIDNALGKECQIRDDHWATKRLDLAAKENVV